MKTYNEFLSKKEQLESVYLAIITGLYVFLPKWLFTKLFD